MELISWTSHKSDAIRNLTLTVESRDIQNTDWHCPVFLDPIYEGMKRIVWIVDWLNWVKLEAVMPYRWLIDDWWIQNQFFDLTSYNAPWICHWLQTNLILKFMMKFSKIKPQFLRIWRVFDPINLSPLFFLIYPPHFSYILIFPHSLCRVKFLIFFHSLTRLRSPKW